MTSILFYTVALLILSGAIALGSLAAFQMTGKSRQLQPIVMAFALGVVLGLAFFHIIPEALSALSIWLVILLVAAGGGMMWGIDRLLGERHSCCHTGEQDKAAPRELFLGFAACAATDGFLLVTSYGESWIAASVVLGVLALHRAPLAAAITTLLNAAGYSKRYIALFIGSLMFLTASTVLLGAFGISYASPFWLMALETLSAGILLHLAWARLLPFLHMPTASHLRWSNRAAVLAGVILFMGLGWSGTLAHDHSGAHDHEHEAELHADADHHHDHE